MSDDSGRSCVMVLGQIGQTRLFLSCIVLVAAAVTAAIAAAMTSWQGNSDLPMVVLIGTGFWCGGWLVQIVAQWAASRWCGQWPDECTINLIGVESYPRRWTVGQSLIVSFSSIAALMVCGILFWWADGGFLLGTLAPSTPLFWPPPSIGLSSSDSIWRVGAWLFWVQAICQMFPLPGSTGRQLLASMTARCSRHLDRSSQVTVLRRILVGISLVTLVIAIAMISGDGGTRVPRWPFVMLLSVLLWTSSRSSDLDAMIMMFCSTRDPEALSEWTTDTTEQISHYRSEETSPLRIIQRSRQAMRERKERRIASQAIEQQQREATDAARLDEILDQIHENGPNSLSREDRAILDRVSHALQKRRADTTDASNQHGVSQDAPNRDTPDPDGLP